MANVINISNKLNNEPTYIALGDGKQYKVDNNYKTLMKASALFEGENVNETDSMMKAIELIIGKNARAEVENMPIHNVKVIFTAVMAAVQNVSYEEMESRFQEQA